MSYLYAVDVPDMASSNFYPEKGTCTALYIYLFALVYHSIPYVPEKL